MLLIACPHCGPRPETDFTYAGEAHLVRNPADAADDAWTAHLYLRSNPKGRHAERWRHAHGCGRFFNAVRDTVTDRIITTYRAGEGRPPVGAPRPDDSGEGGR